MATFFRPTPFRRFIAGLLSALLSLGPVATPAYAAVTSLADEPLATRNQSKPNILMTVDDSTSMLYDFLPDYVVEGQRLLPRRAIGQDECVLWLGRRIYDFTARSRRRQVPGPQYILQQYNSRTRLCTSWPLSVARFDTRQRPGGRLRTLSTRRSAARLASTRPAAEPIPSASRPTRRRHPPMPAKPYEYWLLWPAPAHNSALNKLYYNPRLTYDPPIGDDGNPLPNMNAANTSNWTQVPADPWAATSSRSTSPPRSPSASGATPTGRRATTHRATRSSPILATAAPTAPSMRRRRRRPTATTATRGRRPASPPTTRSPRSTRQPSRRRRRGRASGQCNGEPALLPERQRDLVQHEEQRVARGQGPRREAASCRPPRPAPANRGHLRDIGYGTARRSNAQCTVLGADCNGSPLRCATECRRRLAMARSPPAARWRRPAAQARADLQHDQPDLQQRQDPDLQRSGHSCERAASCVNVWQPTGCNCSSRILKATASWSSSATGSAASAQTWIAPTMRRSAPTLASAASPTLVHRRQRGDRLPDDRRHLQRQRRAMTVRQHSALDGEDGAASARAPTARPPPAPTPVAPATSHGADCPSRHLLHDQPLRRHGGGVRACTTSPNNCAIIGGKCSVSNALVHDQRNCPTVAGTCSVSGASCTSQRQLPGDRHGDLQHLGRGLHGPELPDESRYLQRQLSQPERGLHANSRLHDQAALLHQRMPPSDLHWQHDNQVTAPAPGWHLQRHVRQRQGVACTSQLATCTTKPGTCVSNAANCRSKLHQVARTARSKTGVCSIAGAACRRELHAERPIAPTASRPRSAARAASTASLRHDAARRRQRRGPRLPPQQQGLRRRHRRAQQLPRCDVQRAGHRRLRRRRPASPPRATSWSRATTGRPASSGATRRSPPPATSGRASARRPAAAASRSRTRRTSTRATTSSAPTRAPTT